MGNRGTNDFEKSEESFLTKDESFSDGEREFFNVGREFLYTSCGPAAHAFLPLRSIQAHTASAGQAGFASHKPLCFRPSGLQTPPVLRRRRYNTLDLASKIVCQRRPCPLWIPPPRNHPVSLDSSPQRRPEHPYHAPAFSAQRGVSPLDTPC